MKGRDIGRLGIPKGACFDAAIDALRSAHAAGRDDCDLQRELARVAKAPAEHLDDALWGALAALLVEANSSAPPFAPREGAAPCRIFGEHLEEGALEQIRNACRLPVALAAALMPDAHQGYGLPIGGVLATENAVIPYAVGVDIACRMKMTVLDRPVTALRSQQDELASALEGETRFGIGATFRSRRQHEVMDEDWGGSSVTGSLKDRAWSQLGTSGSGNHFVEFGVLTVLDASAGLQPGEYLALLSHSGSRGTGNAVAQHYSRLANRQHPELPRELARLAWLDLASEEGQEYLGGDGADGPVCRGQPPVDPRARGEGAGRVGAARYREPPQLRMAGAPPSAGRHRARRDRAPQGGDAGGGGRPRDHPGIDGGPGLAGQGHRIGSLAPFGFARRRAPDEPDEGERTVHVG